MYTTKKVVEAQEVYRRAAQIRGNWSPTERRRRTGLPPDVPEKLRDYFLGWGTAQWAVVSQSR